MGDSQILIYKSFTLSVLDNMLAFYAQIIHNCSKKSDNFNLLFPPEN
jgi:hypothetical protein